MARSQRHWPLFKLFGNGISSVCVCVCVCARACLLASDSLRPYGL